MLAVAGERGVLRVAGAGVDARPCAGWRAAARRSWRGGWFRAVRASGGLPSPSRSATCPPIMPPTVPAAVGEFARSGAPCGRSRRVELREHLERQRQQRIAGQDRHGIAEDFVVGELAAAVVVVVERGQIVVDQRVGVDQFQRAGGRDDAVGTRRRRCAPPRCRGSAGCACRRRTGCSAWRGEWSPAAWIPGGTRRSSSASTSCCCWARYSRRFMRSGLFRAERLGGHLAFLADQHFDARFRLFELFAAGVAEAHARARKVRAIVPATGRRLPVRLTTFSSSSRQVSKLFRPASRPVGFPPSPHSSNLALLFPQRDRRLNPRWPAPPDLPRQAPPRQRSAIPLRPATRDPAASRHIAAASVICSRNSEATAPPARPQPRRLAAGPLTVRTMWRAVRSDGHPDPQFTAPAAPPRTTASHTARSPPAAPSDPEKCRQQRHQPFLPQRGLDLLLQGERLRSAARRRPLRSRPCAPRR